MSRKARTIVVLVAALALIIGGCVVGGITRNIAPFLALVGAGHGLLVCSDWIVEGRF